MPLAVLETEEIAVIIEIKIDNSIFLSESSINKASGGIGKKIDSVKELRINTGIAHGLSPKLKTHSEMIEIILNISIKN